ncbi:MAG: ectonucleotide pyrophosphatase/phosphodiesterase [Clostridiales bacterium]|nr:ectonucleotide pyrophosphatase/phosphodiesterase [Clostridiales bacterium]
MLIVSFDAVGDDEFEALARYPAFSALSAQSAVFRGVTGVYLSNTYPVHVSVATGALPGIHGVTTNTEPFPARQPYWLYREDGIRAKTIWQAAAEGGVDTAAVFWPVTAYSKTIRYNVPEVAARPGKSQLLTSLRAGSKGLQLKLFLRHRALLEGLRQPALDSFATACMADILREYKPGLAMIHLTAYDSICHDHGKGSDAIETAFASLDRNLALLLEAAGEDRDVIVFSDHSQVNVHTVLDPNAALVDAGLLEREGEAYLPGESGCFIECCGGSAFFHQGGLSARRMDEIREELSRGEGFRRFLTDGEMRESGRESEAFGFCAEAGYCYEAFGSGHKANHGYPLDMPDYQVFFMIRGSGVEPGSAQWGGRLTDVTRLAAERLGLGMDDTGFI